MGSLSEATLSGGTPKEKNEKKMFFWMAGRTPGLALGYVLYGFVEVVLVSRVSKDGKEDAKVEIELGKNCEIRTQGNELCVIVEDSDSVLVQMRKGSRNGECKQLTETGCMYDKIPDSLQVVDAGRSDSELTLTKGSPLPPGVLCTTEAESNKECFGDGDSGQWTKRRSRCSGLKNYYTGTLDQLHDMEKKNNMLVTGKVVHRHCSDSQEYFVVLFDVYFSERFCTPGPRPSWKSGPSMSAGLSHLSNNYERRKRVLEHELSYSPEDISKIGTCQVVGCKKHMELSETEKSARFDLNSIFTSLPNSVRHETQLTTSLAPGEQEGSRQTGLYQLPNEVLSSILSRLVPLDLYSATAVCSHFRALATSIMPCMNLKLYPHQESAVRWMVQRERPPQTLPYPHSGRLVTEDGREVYFDNVTGDLLPEAPPGVPDFRGGMVCDEPGLGKTVTALSLILKTQGTLATPPPDVVVQWCEHTSHKRTGYYEVSTASVPHGSMSALKRCSLLKARRYQFDTTIKLPSPSWSHTPSSSSSSPSPQNVVSHKQVVGTWRSPRRGGHGLSSPCASISASPIVESRPSVTSDSVRASGSVKRKLWDSTPAKTSKKPRRRSSSTGELKGPVQTTEGMDIDEDEDDTWAQCDACGKWRKIPPEGRPLKEELAWFCSMNKDELHQDCTVPEEIFDKNEMITCLPGFVHASKVTDPEVNVPFFKTVLRSHAHHIDEEAKRALKWLVDLSREKVLKAAVDGLQLPPTLQMATVGGHDLHHYDKILEAFGLTKKKEPKKSARWFYPKNLAGLIFDTLALRDALAEPVDEVMRFYLSKATLVVVPNNLVEHWRTQILKHISKGQLRYFIWNDVRRLPAAHILAWEYDVVITTFTRLSAEWSSRETSALARIHWLRIVLDEGHTLGAGLSMTNKLQMAVSMRACRRWILTGTPTPNTPSTQVAYLQPMLKFLHEETYGNHSKVFDTAILRPFEAGTEEGRQLLLDLLQRCMISARKCDLHSIPACIRKAKLLDFTTEQHAASYNELVVTVRRNILMADWRDPSHVESLLNPKQWKFRNSTLRNVRLSCCVAGHIKVFNAKGDLHETMDMLATQGMSETSDEYQNIKTSLLIGGSCERCSEYCRLPIITPCRHLLCLACVSLDGTKCTLCGHPYQMQSPVDRARPENPNPKWPVPQDLIELQPSYVQDNWDPDWHHISSSKIIYLIQQLKEINARNEKIFSQYVDIMDDTDTHKDKGKTLCSTASPEKVIVFSQFLEHINLIEKQFVNAGINHVGMYSPMQIRDKMKSLKTFKCEPECTVLVMDGSVALGLDLSFVTHVYLMEPIWDRSMEEQVVSRAHRMGAVRPVLVETLAMRGTIEEQMLGLLKGSSGRRNMPQDPAETFLEELDFVKWKN